MKISTLYDISYNMKQKKIARYVYKANKLFVNFFYPRFVRLEYGLDDASDIIVSLTSFPDRIDTVWITVATMLKQTVKPKKIILWLAEEQFPNGEKDLPQKLLDMKKYGLTIAFCDNLYPHKKYYYTMKDYPENTIITVDDDVFYPEYLIEELKKTSERYPHTVCCTWAHRMHVDKNGRIAEYDTWESGIGKMDKPEMLVMPVGIGGVLYPAGCLDSRAFDEEAIKKIALRTDDLWLKAMEVLAGTPAVRIAKVYDRTFFTVLRTQKSGLKDTNVKEKKNDVALCRIMENYPEIFEKLAN